MHDPEYYVITCTPSQNLVTPASHLEINTPREALTTTDDTLPATLQIYINTSGGSRISQRGRQPQRGAPTYYFTNFFWKPHENKEILLPLRSATVLILTTHSPTTWPTNGSRGKQDPAPPRPPDLEAVVYNLRAKQWILGPLLYIFFKKVFSLTLLSMNILLISLKSPFHLLICVLLHDINSSHNLSYL